MDKWLYGYVHGNNEKERGRVEDLRQAENLF